MNALIQQHVIDGQPVEPASGQYIDLIDPVTGEVVGKAAAVALACHLLHGHLYIAGRVEVSGQQTPKGSLQPAL